MSKTVSAKPIKTVSLEDAQQASRMYAEAKARLNKVEVKMNTDITKVKAKYSQEITDAQTEMQDAEKKLQQYATEQKTEERKRFDLLHCIVGWRLNPPKVEKAEGSTWETITKAAQKFFPKIIRTEASLDKKAIVALSKEKEWTKVKEKLGIDVIQEEAFFITAKTEQLVS
jgi:phage host-nuclease inhibitor protein Gam